MLEKELHSGLIVYERRQELRKQSNESDDYEFVCRAARANPFKKRLSE